MVFSIKKFELGVNRCTSRPLTQQNVNFTKSAFSQLVSKIETSGWDQNIAKFHVHILVTILAQIDTLPVM